MELNWIFLRFNFHFLVMFRVVKRISGNGILKNVLTVFRLTMGMSEGWHVVAFDTLYWGKCHANLENIIYQNCQENIKRTHKSPKIAAKKSPMEKILLHVGSSYSVTNRLSQISRIFWDANKQCSKINWQNIYKKFQKLVNGKIFVIP